MSPVETARPRTRSAWLWGRILFCFALFVAIGLLSALTSCPLSHGYPCRT